LPRRLQDVPPQQASTRFRSREPRSIIAGDYDNDGAVDLLNHAESRHCCPAANEGGNRNNSLRLALKGLNDNKSAIGARSKVFSAGLRRKLRCTDHPDISDQNSPYLTMASAMRGS